MLLAGISEFSSVVDMGFIMDNWKSRDSFVSMETDSPLVQLLVIIGSQARHLGRIAIQDIKGKRTPLDFFEAPHALSDFCC